MTDISNDRTDGSSAVFKRCGSCHRAWPDERSLIDDPGLRLLGLQAVPGLPDANLLVFEHDCGTSVSVLATKLRHLLDQAAGDDWPRLYGTDACAGHCLVL